MRGIANIYKPILHIANIVHNEVLEGSNNNNFNNLFQVLISQEQIPVQ